MRPARVGGHRTLLRTLDVRTLAIAGGSLVRAPDGGTGPLRDVGPRSAHIAGFGYACFAPPGALAGARVIFVRPLAGDPGDYLALETPAGLRFALTPTCAANLLGYVGETDFARGDRANAELGFALAGERLHRSGDALAREVLERAADKLRAAIDELIDDYELEREAVELVGGGGGAAALVPFAAERFGLRHRLARDAEVISPLGVALALVRDVVERTIVAPAANDVLAVRREAFERVVAAGAAPDFVTVSVDIDTRRNLVRATASGATAATAGAAVTAAASNDERRDAALRTLRGEARELSLVASVGEFAVFARTVRGATDVCAVDARAVVRYAARRALVRACTVDTLPRVLAAILDEATAYGDVGRALPGIALAYGGRTVDLGTLAEPDQVVALAGEEVRGLPGDTAVAVIAAMRLA
jgi:hypothetical protein